MNERNTFTLMQSAFDVAEPGCTAALTRYKLPEFQNLPREDLLLAQSIAGHGDLWGIWMTPAANFPGKLSKCCRSIDIAKRLRTILSKEAQTELSPDLVNVQVEVAVLVITRLALLVRLTPTSGSLSKNLRLKPQTIAGRIYGYCIPMIARAIKRKILQPETKGLFSCLTEDDVRELGQNVFYRRELDRLGTLAARGLWNDMPPQLDTSQTTNPRGPKSEQVPQKIAGEWKPISDKYLAEFGPRNLWLICDMGPNLLNLLGDLATYLENLDWSKMRLGKLVGEKGDLANFIAKHLQENEWKGSTGLPLKPYFPLKIGKRAKDSFDWPPRHYQHLRILSGILQSAHLFITLLGSAGRIGEIETLPRSCVSTERDGMDYIHGWTYKLSGNLYGDARQWPAPKVLVQSLGQQARLANVWSRLPANRVDYGVQIAPSVSGPLWLSLGASPKSKATEPLADPRKALQKLAERIGMDPKPGGISIHPHRLRKTVGRLAGIALFDSPLVLKRLFGHKSIEMVLHYILCDPDIRTEAEAVLRELRIMHCAETLEEIRENIASSTPLLFHSGLAVTRMVEAVNEHEVRLAKSNRVWTEGSAYDLAYLLTSRGQGWRFIQKNIICAKVPGESGLCRKNKGEPDTSNCQPECGNRVVLAMQRRDVVEIVESHLDVARTSLNEGQYGVVNYSMKRVLEELDAFPEIKDQYMTDPQVQSLIAIYEGLS